MINLGQVNFEPMGNSVYSYLERMSNKGIILLNEEIKPFTRIYIAKKLTEIYKDKTKLSLLEKEELNFYIIEYASELNETGFDLSQIKKDKKIFSLWNYIGYDEFGRLRLLKYEDEKFKIFIDPLLRYNFTKTSIGNSSLWSNGLGIYGNIGGNIGFDLQFYDNHFQGELKNFERSFSPQTGYEWNSPRGNGIDFDRMNANLTFSWEWGNFTLGKDFNSFGNGENGNIILSNKAPSFPHIKLEAYPVAWLRFSYIHGLLNSQVLDSTTFRFNPQRNHISTVDKYFVTHYLSITPLNFVNFSFGESVIYSDKFQPIYLIPIAFFRLADHYLSDPDENAGNAQLFASFWYKNFSLRTKFYGSIFIDELSISNSDYPQSLAYNIGLKTIDPVIPESEFVVEYTKILPFVYFHSDSAQTYENYGYQLGHWIGSNADQIYVKFRKRIIRGLNIDLWYSFIRKGEEEDFNEPRYQEGHTFLWGLNKHYTEYGINLSYEITHNFFMNLNYININISSEQENGSFVSNKENLFNISVGYGIF